MRRSSRDKHSFIQFYFDDWSAGTARMTRLVRSIYFDICLYGWDKLKPMSPAALKLTLGDVENYPQIVDALVETGALERNASGVWSPRALREGERAFAAWGAKSRGGKAARGVEEEPAKMEQSCKTDATVLEDTTTDSDSDSDSEPDSELRGDDVQISPEIIESASAKALIVEAWNAMAAANGLPQVVRITDKRIGHLNARLEEVGLDAMLEGIKLIPRSRFLTGKTEEGWKAHFDWFLQPSSFVKLQEGFYHSRTRAKGDSAWTQ